MGDKQHVAAFLLELSSDTAKLDAYNADPDGVMDAAGLSDADKAVVKSGDVQKIRAHLGEDDPPGCVLLLA